MMADKPSYPGVYAGEAGRERSIPDDPAASGNVSEVDLSVFRAFERGEFLEWPSWARVRRIIRSNGGSYGISGPRGAGKSWLMLRAISEARAPEDEQRRRGIGLWYPTPSEYNALAFLASLSDALVAEIERRFSPGLTVRILGSRWMTLLVALIAAVYAIHNDGAGWAPGAWAQRIVHAPKLVQTSSGAQGFTHTTDFGELAKVVFLAGLAAAAWKLLFEVAMSAKREARLLREASAVRSRARYTSTLRDASEVGAEASYTVVGRWRRSREQELVERPSTVSSLVNDFRSLAEHAGQVTGRVVIAIDELDKMDDTRRVKELLRDVKGIFDVPHVHYFVSVSDEAARSLNLGALTGRSEFNSSFYTVIELPPVSPSGLVGLLDQRAAVNPRVGRVLAVLAGGNPRELLRLAESLNKETGVVSNEPNRRPNIASEMNEETAVIRTLRDEALNLRREIVTATETTMNDEARIGSFRALPDDAFVSYGAFRAFADAALTDEMWEPRFADDEWRTAFAEPWRRLLVRLIVGARLIEDPLDDEERLLQLRDVVIAATESAAVAKIVFEERLRVETRVSA